jgi:hypothetical protein
MTEVFVTIEADNSKAIASIQELESYVREMYELIKSGQGAIVNDDVWKEASEKLYELKEAAKQSNVETKNLEGSLNDAGTGAEEAGKQFKQTGDDVSIGMRLGTAAVKELAKSSETASQVISDGNKIASLAMGKRISLEKEFTKLLGKSKTASMLYAGAQSLIAWATGGATLATNAFRIALIATGIGAVIVLIGALVVNWDRLSGSIRDSEGNLTAFGKYLLFILGPIGWLINAIDKSVQAIGGWGAAWAGVKAQVMDMLVVIGDVVASVANLDFAETFKLFFTAGARSRKAFNDGANEFVQEAEEAAYKKSLEAMIRNKEQLIAVEKAKGNDTLELERQLLESKMNLQEKESEEWFAAQNDLLVFDAKVNKARIDADNAAADEASAIIDRQLEKEEAAREQRIEGERKEQERKKQIRDEFAEIFRTMDMTDTELQLDKIEQKRIALQAAGVGEVELKAWVEAQKKIVQDGIDAEADAKKQEADAALLEVTRENALAALETAREVAAQELEWKFEKEMQDALLLENSEAVRAQIIMKYDRLIAEQKQLYDQEDEDATHRQMELDYMATKAKLQLASQTLGDISGLFKKHTKAAKAAAVAQATVDTFSAAWSIFKNASLNPTTVLFPGFPFIQAGIAVAAGIKNVKSILAVPETGGGAPSGSVAMPSFSSTSSGGGTSGVDFSFLGQGGQANASGFESLETPSEGAAKGIKAFVVSSDITTQQAIDQKIDEQASLVGG